MFIYSKKKCQTILHNTYTRYQKKKETLSEPIRQELQNAILLLQASINENDKSKMKESAIKLIQLRKQHLKKTTLETTLETSIGIAAALLIALLIRPMVFELYVVPTGSMRPTILEQDRLFVSKTAFGINIPLIPKQFYFDPNLVTRCDGVAFTGENLDIPNVDVMNFYILPGKKQLVKRLLGKPGDTLYFYGGQMYGVDKDDNDITEALQPPYLTHISHVPFITFEGKVKTPLSSPQGIATPSIFTQYGMPVAELDAITPSMVHGKLFPQKGANEHERTFNHYYDMWGMGNYGMVRLLTPKQVQKFSKTVQLDQEAVAYLEISHHPNLYNATVGRDIKGRARPQLGIFTSYLAVTDKHLHRLFSHMTTMRFIVKNGKFFQYSFEGIKNEYHRYAPSFEGIPDGTYEYYNGDVYKIHTMGFRTRVHHEHPLTKYSPEKTLFFFNLGIEMFSPFIPKSSDDLLRPSRYTFFKNGDLYLLGHPIIKKNDPQLVDFIQNEYLKQSIGTTLRPYPPFQDMGAPLLPTGELDKDLIKEKGLAIPPDHYLALGDNYEASLDSRDFGFLPQSNIRGAPTFIFWPISPRFGSFPQPAMHYFNIPRILMWSLVIIAFALYSYRSYKKRNTPITF